jgi:hypothetical protein
MAVTLQIELQEQAQTVARLVIRTQRLKAVAVGEQRHAIAAPPRSTVLRCLRPDGDLFYHPQAPDSTTKPIVLLLVPVF